MAPRLFTSLLTLLLPLYAVAADTGVSEAIGPLRVNQDNPSWFVRPDGQAVWLTGSHTWANFQERGVEGQTPDFDCDRFLDNDNRVVNNTVDGKISVSETENVARDNHP